MENVVDGTSLPAEDAGVPSSSRVLAKADDAVVGFKKEKDAISESLAGYEKELKVITIVGMPGIGKTTLAMNLFNSFSVKSSHFDIIAQGVASQNFDKRRFILSILSQLKAHSSMDVSQSDEETLAEMLCKSLKRRRYLILIDDVWDTNVWQDLKRYLPDDKQGSRILITTRNNVVASDIGSEVHSIGLLGEDESWELFQKRLSQKDNLSKNLLNIAKKISEGCNGLPLSIVVIAGALSNVERSEPRWNQIARSMNLHILNDPQSNCKTILDMSFSTLPHRLQQCFLYLGVFPEDKEISVSRLTWLWMAEGFVQDTELKSSEDVAKDYILNLLGRNLVIPAKERSEGEVKTFQLHDLLHNFCLEKAKEGQHILRILNQRNTLSIRLIGNPPGTNQGWLSSNNICSLLSFSFGEWNKMSQLVKSKGTVQLQVLESAHPLGDLSHLVCLRYLAIQGSLPTIFSYMQQVSMYQNLHTPELDALTRSTKFHTGDKLACPFEKFLTVFQDLQTFDSDNAFSMSSVTKLQNLQTFIFEKTLNSKHDAVEVPDSIWDLVKLRHLHVRSRASFELDILRIQNNPSFLLEDLRSLSKPKLSHDDLKWLKRLPKLQKLCCTISETWDDSQKCHHLPEMDFLSQLMSLNMELCVQSKGGMRRYKFHLPLNLKELTLKNFILNSEDVSGLGKMLPFLQVFKLYMSGPWDSKEVEEWSVSDEDFPKLRVLKSAGLRFNKWTMSEGSFPCLEKLWVESCPHLQAIPLEFGDIPMLRLIYVRDCKPSVDRSAKEIKSIQQEGQNEELEVYIYPKEALCEVLKLYINPKKTK